MLADFNVEIIFCYYIQALSYSVIAERLTNEILISSNPKLELYQKAQDNLLEASRICHFLANHAMLLTPFHCKKVNIIPELNKNIMNGLSILFYAEAQLVAEEKSNDKSLSISFHTRAGILMDTSMLFKQCLEFIEKGIGELDKKVKEFMKSYYLDYIKGQILFCEGLAYYFSSKRYQEENPNVEELPENKKKRLILEGKSFKFIKKFELEYKSKLYKNWKFFDTYVTPILSKYEE